MSWGRSGEPASRWRNLLERALHARPQPDEVGESPPWLPGPRVQEPYTRGYPTDYPPPPNGVDALTEILRADLGGPRVIAFANPKGGVHKTTATVLCAATVG